MKQTAFVAVVALLVSGCMVGPDYSRPPVVVPDNYRFAVAPATAESIADLPWFDVFRDPVLQQLVREALENNYDLRIAAARVEEARANIGIVRSFLFPQVNATGGGIVQQVSQLTEPSQTLGSPHRVFQNWLFGLGLVWEFDIFGRIRRETESATSTFLATEQAQRGVLITLVGDVAQSYFTLRELDLELEIARRTVQLNDETVLFYQTRLTGGASNRLEVDTAISNRSRTGSTIPELERQIAIQENQINLLLGRNPGPIPRGTALTEQYSPPSIPAGLPSALLERRPDIKTAEDLLVAANADIGAAKALFFPNFSLTAALGSASHELSNIANRRAAVWSVAGGVLQPVFQGWRLTSNYEAVKARFDQAVAQYQRSAQNGFREVADALVSIEKLAGVRDELEVGVRALQDASILARLRYDTGLANYLEILIADQQLFDQELALARARGGQLNALVQFYRALGGGWQ
jgi:multidrug efflux system outer membrane protein